MMRRLFLALLLLCLALPATAAMPCHDGVAMPETMAMPAGDGSTTPDHRDRSVPAHVCVGCIPPSSWRAAPAAAPLPTAAVRPTLPLARLDLRSDMPPATPPPRRVV